MEVVSAVVTWLGALSVVAAVLTFRFGGPVIRLRGEVDANRNVRLIAINHGRIAGYISRLGIGTPRRRRLRLRRSYAASVEPAIVISGFTATELRVGELKVWTTTWPSDGVRAERRTLSSEVVKTRRVDPGSRSVRVYGTVNGKFRTGRITYAKDATFQ
jgi:hypothetical protein